MVTLGNYFCYDSFGLFCFRSLVASVCTQNRDFQVLDFFVAGISLIVVQYIVLPFTGADLAGQKFSYPQLYIPISVLGIGAWLMIAKGIRKILCLNGWEEIHLFFLLFKSQSIVW